MDTDRSAEQRVEAPAGVVYCARHPQVETTLTCGRCGTPICPRCLVQTPVGARCPACAGVSRIPTLDVKPVFIARGLAAALGAGAAIGGIWGYTIGDRTFFGFLMIAVALGLGYAISEAIAAATNRKRGVPLQACAVLGVLVAYVVRNAVIDAALLPQGDVMGYALVIIGAFFAAYRLKPY